MKEKLLLIAERDSSVLGTVRCVSGLMVAKDDRGIWLKCAHETSDNILVKQLPVKQTFFIDDRNYLFYANALTPVGVLHIETWQTIKHFIPIELPVAAMPAEANMAIGIRLVRSSVPQKANALLTSLNTWKSYAEYAPSIRLQQLRFAVSENEEVFITGTPLPSIPGRAYWIDKGIALPCGYELEWSFLAVAVVQQYSAADELMLFDEKGECQKIPNTFFVQAHRTAIRRTRVS